MVFGEGVVPQLRHCHLGVTSCGKHEKHKLCLESYRCLPNKDQPLTTVEDPMVQANRFSDFYVLVVVAAAAKAKGLCDHNGR